MEKIEIPNPSRQATYSKRRDGIIKKATELSELCDADIGLLMFSPAGHLTSFGTNGRVADVFLRFVAHPNELRGGPIENEEHLYHSLRHLKFERKMLDKIEKLEALQKKLHELNQRKNVVQEKLRLYNPDLEKITSVHHAQAQHQFLINAIRSVAQIKAKLLSKENVTEKPENVEVPGCNIKDVESATEESIASNRNWNPARNEACSAGLGAGRLGPHLSLEYLKNQRQWQSKWNNEKQQEQCKIDDQPT